MRPGLAAAILLFATYSVAGPAWPDVSAPAPGRASPNDAALVVGVERYAFLPGVPGAVQNAEDWYSYLTRTRGISPANVTLLRDRQASREKILRAAAEAAKLVRPDGTLWVIFIGHGAPAQDGKEGVLVGADADQDPVSLYARSISQGELREAISAGRHRQAVTVLDACFSGRTTAGAPLVEGLQPLIAVRTHKPEKNSRELQLVAAGSDEFAGPLAGLARPAFSYLVLGALRGWGDMNSDRSVTAEEAVTYAREALRATVKDRIQTPALVGPTGAMLAAQVNEKGPDLASLVLGASAASVVTASLLLSADEAGAQLWLDGEARGESPVVIDAVSLGKHSIEARLPDGRTATREVEVTGGGLLKVSIAIPAKPAMLQPTGGPSAPTVVAETARVFSPAPGAATRSLSPAIYAYPFKSMYSFYGFELASSPTFDELIDSAYLPHVYNVRHYLGADAEVGTADDLFYVAWKTSKVLEPDRTYYWRVTGYFFPRIPHWGEETAAQLVRRYPRDKAQARSTVEGSFLVPRALGGEGLADVVRVSRAGETTTGRPSINRKNEVAFAALSERGSEIVAVGIERPAAGPAQPDGAAQQVTHSALRATDLWPQWDSRDQGIFFASDRGGNDTNIWFKHLGGRGYQRVTFHDGAASRPSVSPDGAVVVYDVKNLCENPPCYNPEDSHSIWVTSRNGRDATKLVDGLQPRFSPDGKRIAYATYTRGALQVWVMDADGGNRIQITEDHCFECLGSQMPAWHPDGKRLAFVSDRSGNNEIWLVELSGARMVQLTNYLGDDLSPEFTADGRGLVFASTRGGKSGIWMGRLQ